VVCYDSDSESGTCAIAARVASAVRPGMLIGLSGELGAGKTVFVRGLVAALGGNPAQVRSPTFTLMNVYEARLPVFHFDLYRLREAGELDGIGFDEFAHGEGVAVAEWADRFAEVVEAADAWIDLAFGEGDSSRRITVRGLEIAGEG